MSLARKVMPGLAFTAVICLAGTAQGQPYDPGPLVTVPGSSMSGMRIDGAPKLDAPRVRNAPVFGDTVEERAYGRDYDNSYLTPKVPRGRGDDDPIELRATQGRSQLDGVNSGAFARQGPEAIGRSSVTRGRSKGSHRAIIRR